MFDFTLNQAHKCWSKNKQGERLKAKKEEILNPSRKHLTVMGSWSRQPATGPCAP
jgi:hypothetical protein